MRNLTFENIQSLDESFKILADESEQKFGLITSLNYADGRRDAIELCRDYLRIHFPDLAPLDTDTPLVSLSKRD